MGYLELNDGLPESVTELFTDEERAAFTLRHGSPDAPFVLDTFATEYVPANYNDPAEGGDFEITNIEDEKGLKVILTAEQDAELEKYALAVLKHNAWTQEKYGY